MFVPKANADEGGIMPAVCLFRQCNQSIHVTDGVTVTSLSNSLQYKTSAAMNHVCQIALNQTLLLNPLALEFFFLILAHSVYKM